MPRKEELSIEERLERAKELYTRKQQEKQKEITRLYNTKIYKLAKKSCIAFLWIAQLIIIDWILPYKEIPDTITAGCMPHNERYNRRSASKEVNLPINTTQYNKIEILLFRGTIEPEISDSVIVLKSLLLREVKKLQDINNKQTYTATNTVTYYLLPILIMCTLLSTMFLFIKNIEVKAFFYFIFVINVGSIIALISYFTATQMR